MKLRGDWESTGTRGERDTRPEPLWGGHAARARDCLKLLPRLFTSCTCGSPEEENNCVPGTVVPVSSTNRERAREGKKNCL